MATEEGASTQEKWAAPPLHWEVPTCKEKGLEAPWTSQHEGWPHTQGICMPTTSDLHDSGNKSTMAHSYALREADAREATEHKNDDGWGSDRQFVEEVAAVLLSY